MTHTADLLTTSEMDRPSRVAPDGLISVLVPVTGRPDNLVELYREYSAPFKEQGIPFEFVFSAAPYCAPFVRELDDLIAAGEPVRALVAQTTSEAALLRVGAAALRGDVIVTLPAFRRIAAPGLLDLILPLNDGVDFVVARRWPRSDAWVNRLQASVFNWMTKPLRGETLHDVASGVHAMRRDVITELPLYGDLFRFLPILAVGAGFSVAEVNATPHPTDRRARLYRPDVYVRRLVDVMGLFFLVRFTEKPLRFFGLIGSAGFLTGSALLLLIFIQRMLGQGVADRPLMILGVLAIVLGAQAVGLGLVGEIIVHLNIRRTRRYRLLGELTSGGRDARVPATAVEKKNGALESA
jgi:hypothetical protein